jgi:DNA-binding NtrC family response regulator
MAERVLFVAEEPVQRRPAENIVNKAGDGDDGSPGRVLMPPALTGGGSTLHLLDDDGNVRSLEDIEADVIRFALAHYRGQRSEVARRLHIGRSTLYRKLETLGCTMANDTAT